MFLLGLSCTIHADPAQPLTAAGEELNNLGRSWSVDDLWMIYLSEVCNMWLTMFWQFTGYTVWDRARPERKLCHIVHVSLAPGVYLAMCIPSAFIFTKLCCFLPVCFVLFVIFGPVICLLRSQANSTMLLHFEARIIPIIVLLHALETKSPNMLNAIPA